MRALVLLSSHAAAVANGASFRRYAWDVKNIIESCTPGKVAGFIAETIQGVGGSVELPPGYLKAVYEHVRKAGGTTLSDRLLSLILGLNYTY